MQTYCIYCGHSHPMLTWPKKCTGCQREMFSNPKPVGIVIVEIQGGVVLVKRAIPPQVGGLALPGGYVNSGETAEAAAARELFEETGLMVDPATLTLLALKSELRADCLLMFFQAPKLNLTITDLQLSPEVQEFQLAASPQELAFSLHTEVLRQYFQNQRT